MKIISTEFIDDNKITIEYSDKMIRFFNKRAFKKILKNLDKMGFDVSNTVYYNSDLKLTMTFNNLSKK